MPVFLELPAVNDVSVEDERIAGVLFQKLHQLLGFGARSAQMHVGNYNGFMMCLQGQTRYFGFSKLRRSFYLNVKPIL